MQKFHPQNLLLYLCCCKICNFVRRPETFWSPCGTRSLVLYLHCSTLSSHAKASMVALSESHECTVFPFFLLPTPAK